MRQIYRQPAQRRLRKQPKMRRVQAVAAISRPTLTVPKTARKRRRRNNRPFHLPMAGIRKVVFSARWVSLSLFALSVYALVLVGLDEHFYLTVIPVEGVVSVPAMEVVEASGLAGSHVFSADPNLAATRITELPGVVSAKVILRWPNEVSIQIQEDSPVAVWQEGSNRFWVTRDGQLIPSRIGSQNLLLIESNMTPIISDEPEEEPHTAMAFIPSEVLDGALLLHELRPNIEKLFFRPSTGLSYEDGRGWRVYFGSGTDMQQKLVVYETIVEELLARELTPTYISVSNQEKPYYLAQ